MAVTKTDLVTLMGEVTCVAETVESGVGYLYLGTNRGRIYKYNIATGAVTNVQPLSGKITCIVYDASTYIYIGTDKGIIYRYTVSGGAITTLYTADDAVTSLTIYSSTLWGGFSGGRVVKVTTS
jgi:ligand-binding sensor domain-containing protein